MSQASPVRAIVGARTSVFTDQKVSHLAQNESGARYCSQQGWPVVGQFSDLGVSATISPWDRESLGPWLSPEQSGTYDAIVWAKVDRAFRSAKDAADTSHWAEQNRKVLVFVDDGIVLDYRQDANSMSGMMAKMFLMLSSMFGEMELRRFRQRATDTHSTLRTTTRWASGVPPLGYKTIDAPDGHGKTLTTDDYGKALLHGMADELLAGSSFTAIADGLNKRQAQSNMSRAGNRPRTWTTSTVKRALTTLRTQGVKMSHNEPVLDAEGEYVRIAEPTFSDDMWAMIQQASAQRELSGKRRAVSDNPLLGVGYCGECRASLTRKLREQGNSFYRCGRTPVACPGVGIVTDEAEAILAECLTSVIGHLHVTRRVFVPGTDNSRELARVKETIARLRRESDAGLITTEQDESDYLHRMRTLTGRRDVLAASPVESAGWRTEYDADTYADRYATLDAIGRRDLLRASGIRLYVSRGQDPEVMFPGDLTGRMGLPADAGSWTSGVWSDTDWSSTPTLAP